METIIKPATYIIVYENGYAEGGGFKNAKDKYSFGPAHAMNSEEISSIIQTSETAIAKEYANSIINDVHLISIGGRLSNPTLCWMIPSGFKDLSFSEEIGIKSGKYWLPTTIFKLYSQEETLEVVVADETIWIDAFNMSLHKYKNPLYRCPYLNMQNDTVNCMGDAVPLTEGFSIAQIMNAWTKNVELLRSIVTRI